MSFNNMSFDNLNNAGTKKASLLFMVLLTATASAVILFIPFVSFIGLAFLAVPAVLLVALHRVRDAFICAIAGVLVIFVFNYVLAIVMLIIIAGLSLCYRYVVGREKRVVFALIIIFFIFMSSILFFFLIDSAITQTNSFKETSAAYRQYVDGLPEDFYIRDYKDFLMIEDSQFETVLLQVQSVLGFLPKLLPGLLVVFFGLVTVLNYSFSTILFKRFDAKINPLPPFKEWDLSWYWCWGIIVGIILVIIPSFNRNYNMLIDAAGYNLIILFGFLYLVLGIATLWGILERFNVRNTMKYLVTAVIFLFFGFFIFLPALGLVDIWANFRKLDRSQ